MKVAIHQPNYLPYVGFFHKLSLADTFVIMDDTQYDKKFTNRNKIKVPGNWIWLTVPINKKHKFVANKIVEIKIWLTVPINKKHKFVANKIVEINNEENWQSDHFEKINRSYSNSEFFKKNYKTFFEKIYSKKWDHLFTLNYELIIQLIDWLDIKIEVIKESELNINGNSTDRLVNISKKIGAETYVSGIGGKEYMNKKMFETNNIKIEYQNFKCPIYKQVFNSEFIPNLSIIDLLFNIGPKSLSKLKQNEDKK